MLSLKTFVPRLLSLLLTLLAALALVACAGDATSTPTPSPTLSPTASPTPPGEPSGASPEPVKGPFQGGVVATFRSGGHTFKAFVTNSQAIDQLFQLLRGESQAKIPNGALRAGPGPSGVNAPWSWHLDPQDFEMAEFTIEVCDGTPDMVEDDLDYWLDTVQRYCPWNAELVSLQDYR